MSSRRGREATINSCHMWRLQLHMADIGDNRPHVLSYSMPSLWSVSDRSQSSNTAANKAKRPILPSAMVRRSIVRGCHGAAPDRLTYRLGITRFRKWQLVQNRHKQL